MGFLDKLKKKAKSAIGGDAPPPQAQPEAVPQEVAPEGSEPHPDEEPAYAGPTFDWDGDTYPLPSGWDNLSIEEWFYKFETLRTRMMNIDDEQGLAQMTDEDGDVLDPEEVLLISVFGFKNASSYENFRNWSVYNWAQQTGETPTDCEFRMSGIARDRLLAEKASAMQAPGGALEDVEDVSCEAWAQIQAQIAGGGDHTALIAAAGMDQPKWDRVSAEWTARMSSDTTGAIATHYANAFAGGGQYGGAAAQAASQGVGGDLGDEPIAFELFVEITEAQNAAHHRGEDISAVLASFGMKPMDWSNCGMFWSKKIQQEATKYYHLHNEFTAKYQLKYGTGDGLTQDQREKMVDAKILEMAGAGQAAQILPWLKEYFPEDAEDLDVMDGWLDRACDRCGESGDQARAKALLTVRYPLQEDEDKSQDEWVADELDTLFC